MTIEDIFTPEEIENLRGLIEGEATKWVKRSCFLTTEDIIQSGWALLAEKAHLFNRYRSGAKPTSWFYRVFRNYLITHTRSEYKKYTLFSGGSDVSKFAVKPKISDYANIIELFQGVLSPYAFKLVKLYSKYGRSISSNRILSQFDLCKRDLELLRSEIKTTVGYFHKEGLY